MQQVVGKSLVLLYYNCHNHFMALWILSRTIWISWYKKGISNLDLLEQEKVSGIGIS